MSGWLFLSIGYNGSIRIIELIKDDCNQNSLHDVTEDVFSHSMIEKLIKRLSKFWLLLTIQIYKQLVLKFHAQFLFLFETLKNVDFVKCKLYA